MGNSAKNGECYWCGDDHVSRIHVPPRCLFPEGPREKLITVPTCADHNENYSDDSEFLRAILMLVANDRPSLEAFIDRTLRSLFEVGGIDDPILIGRREPLLDGEIRPAARIERGRFDRAMEKLARGVFFHLFDGQFDGYFEVASPEFRDPEHDYDNSQDAEFDVANALLDKATMTDHPRIEAGVHAPNPEIFSVDYLKFLDMVQFRFEFYESAYLYIESPSDIGKRELLTELERHE